MLKTFLLGLKGCPWRCPWDGAMPKIRWPKHHKHKMLRPLHRSKRLLGTVVAVAAKDIVAKDVVEPVIVKIIRS